MTADENKGILVYVERRRDGGVAAAVLALRVQRSELEPDNHDQENEREQSKVQSQMSHRASPYRV